MYSLYISIDVALTDRSALLHGADQVGIDCVREASQYSFPASSGASVSSREGADMMCPTPFMQNGVTAVTLLIAGFGQGSGTAMRGVQLQ